MISISKTDVGKNQIDNKVLTLKKHIVSRVSGYFPIGVNLAKTMKTYIRFKQHKNRIDLFKSQKIKVFTLYGHSGHSGHVTLTIYINFSSTFLRMSYMKFGLDRLSGF